MRVARRSAGPARIRKTSQKLLASLLVGVACGVAAVAYDGAWVHRVHHHRFEDSGR